MLSTKANDRMFVTLMMMVMMIRGGEKEAVAKMTDDY
jgi:hypothetical protein